MYLLNITFIVTRKKIYIYIYKPLPYSLRILTLHYCHETSVLYSNFPKLPQKPSSKNQEHNSETLISLKTPRVNHIFVFKKINSKFSTSKNKCVFKLLKISPDKRPEKGFCFIFQIKYIKQINLK